MSGDSTVISVSNHKGGVGKTTITAHTGAALADAGYDVLVIDSDPQGTLSMHLTPTIDSLRRYQDKGVLDSTSGEISQQPDGGQAIPSLENRYPNVYEAFYEKQRNDSLAIRLVADNDDEYEDIAENSGFEPGPITENLAVETTDGVDVIPANTRLQGIEKFLSDDSLAVMRLKQFIDDIRGTAGNPDGSDYDYILIDTPASPDGLIKDSAAIAAGNFLIPLQAEGTSVSSTQKHLEDIESIDKSFDLDPNIVGIIPNEVRNDGEADKVLSIIRKKIPDRYRRTHDIPAGLTATDLPDEFWAGETESEEGILLDGIPDTFSNFWTEIGCTPFVTEEGDYTSDVVPFEILTRVAIRRAYSHNRTLYTHDENCDQRSQFDQLAQRVVEKTE